MGKKWKNPYDFGTLRNFQVSATKGSGVDKYTLGLGSCVESLLKVLGLC